MCQILCTRSTHTELICFRWCTRSTHKELICCVDLGAPSEHRVNSVLDGAQDQHTQRVNSVSDGASRSTQTELISVSDLVHKINTQRVNSLCV